MRIVIQRVKSASVEVEGKLVAEIQQGILALVAVENGDVEENAQKLVEKMLNYRIFSDQQGKMNLSLKDIDGELLLVSQFTLAANTNKGLRPSFSSAAAPNDAQALFDYFVNQAKQKHEKVSTGIFAADMQVSLVNDGPVTFLLET